MSDALSVADVLERAADLIEPEGAWTQGVYARDAEGHILGAGTAPEAVCFCALGAIEHIGGHGAPAKAFLARHIMPEGYRSTTHTVGSFNDDPRRTQAEVVAKLREAATLARSREGQ
jgi:hypothetical protein